MKFSVSTLLVVLPLLAAQAPALTLPQGGLVGRAAAAQTGAAAAANSTTATGAAAAANSTTTTGAAGSSADAQSSLSKYHVNLVPFSFLSQSLQPLTLRSLLRVSSRTVKPHRKLAKSPLSRRPITLSTSVLRQTSPSQTVSRSKQDRATLPLWARSLRPPRCHLPSSCPLRTCRTSPPRTWPLPSRWPLRIWRLVTSLTRSRTILPRLNSLMPKAKLSVTRISSLSRCHRSLRPHPPILPSSLSFKV